jgi:3-methyladenine DNA glycosylase AlkD
MRDCRDAARRFADLPLADIEVLLDSPVHEHRTVGLLILAGRDDAREPYLAALRRGRVNNWDLVDLTAYKILADEPLENLLQMAGAESLWERRAAVVATFASIRRGDPGPALAVAERLLEDREDLIHKAVGWMLREVGKRCGEDALRGFLDEHAPAMPRTMLRAAIERLDPDERARYRAMPRVVS